MLLLKILHLDPQVAEFLRLTIVKILNNELYIGRDVV